MARRYIYLIRHAQYTNDRSADEEPDGGLTAEGMNQALLTGQRLIEIPVTMIYHSTSQRAVETCQIISGLLPSTPVQPSHTLKECIPPIPDDLKDYFSDIPQEWIEQGKERARKAQEIFLQPLGGENEDHHDIIISHGNLISYLITQALLAPPFTWPRFDIANCSISKIAINARGFMKVEYVNDTSHLRSGIK